MSRRKPEATACRLIRTGAWLFSEDEVGGRPLNRRPAIKPNAGAAAGGGGIERNLRSNLAPDHVVGESLADGALPCGVTREVVGHLDSDYPERQAHCQGGRAGDHAQPSSMPAQYHVSESSPMPVGRKGSRQR